MELCNNSQYEIIIKSNITFSPVQPIFFNKLSLLLLSANTMFPWRPEFCALSRLEHNKHVLPLLFPCELSRDLQPQTSLLLNQQEPLGAVQILAASGAGRMLGGGGCRVRAAQVESGFL